MNDSKRNLYRFTITVKSKTDWLYTIASLVCSIHAEYMNDPERNLYHFIITQDIA